MGMYDNLKISTSKLPLSDAEKSAIGENADWQTKDFDCILSTAEITDEGKLRLLTPKQGSKSFNTADGTWVDINDMESVNFYTSVNDVWYEFEAEFVEGKLVDIKRVQSIFNL